MKVVQSTNNPLQRHLPMFLKRDSSNDVSRDTSSFPRKLARWRDQAPRTTFRPRASETNAFIRRTRNPYDSSGSRSGTRECLVKARVASRIGRNKRWAVGGATPTKFRHTVAEWGEEEEGSSTSTSRDGIENPSRGPLNSLSNGESGIAFASWSIARMGGGGGGGGGEQGVSVIARYNAAGT